jgi:hypothetical protein
VDPISKEGENVSEASKKAGYGKPPEATRFQKGISGNPKGRPKGSLNVASLFTKISREKVSINENGQRKNMTKLEAALKQIVNRAASGDHRNQRLMLELANAAEARQNASVPPDPVIEELDQEVINDILQRFRLPETDGKESQESIRETNDVDDQRR